MSLLKSDPHFMLHYDRHTCPASLSARNQHDYLAVRNLIVQLHVEPSSALVRAPTPQGASFGASKRMWSAKRGANFACSWS